MLVPLLPLLPLSYLLMLLRVPPALSTSMLCLFLPSNVSLSLRWRLLTAVLGVLTLSLLLEPPSPRCSSLKPKEPLLMLLLLLCALFFESKSLSRTFLLKSLTSFLLILLLLLPPLWLLLLLILPKGTRIPRSRLIISTGGAFSSDSLHTIKLLGRHCLGTLCKTKFLNQNVRPLFYRDFPAMFSARIRFWDAIVSEQSTRRKVSSNAQDRRQIL